MKNIFLKLGIGVTIGIAGFLELSAQEYISPDLQLPPLSPDHPALDNTGRPLTDEDLADPPPGEIRKMHVHDLRVVSESLAVNLAGAVAGHEGQQSPWMPKYQAIKANLDLIVETRLQRDVFALIRKMKEAYEAEDAADYPVFFATQGALVRDAGVCIIHTIAEHIMEQDANVANDDLASFVAVFAVDGFISPNAWEGEEMPIDAAGLMIVDADAVVAYLKTLPWIRADRFVRGDPPGVAFAEYEAGGDGLAILKTRFAANKAQVIAKWNELAAWVEQQRATNP